MGQIIMYLGGIIPLEVSTLGLWFTQYVKRLWNNLSKMDISGRGSVDTGFPRKNVLMDFDMYVTTSTCPT